MVCCSSVPIIPDTVPACKCVLLPLRPLQAENSGGDLPQGHFCYAAHCGPQNGDRLRGVEITDPGKILWGEIGSGFIAAPDKEHKGHAAFQRFLQPDLGIQRVQFLQKTPRRDLGQFSKIICDVILRQNTGCFQQAGGKVCRSCCLEAVFQALHHGGFISHLHPPDGDSMPGAAVGVAHVEHIPQLVGGIGIHQKGNPPGSPIHPPPPAVPKADFGAGGGIRPLGENQQLVPKAVLEVVGGGGEKGQIPPGIRGDLPGSFLRQGHDLLVLAGHILSPFYRSRPRCFGWI